MNFQETFPMTGSMYLQDSLTKAPLCFIPCTKEDLPTVLKGSLEILDELQKDQGLDLSAVRNALISRAETEIDDYTKLMEGSQLIGWYHVIEGLTSLELDDVNILEPFRSKGYGSRILDRVIERARAAKKSVTVTVSGENARAAAFYERHGFSLRHRDARQNLHFTHEADRF